MRKPKDWGQSCPNRFSSVCTLIITTGVFTIIVGQYLALGVTVTAITVGTCTTVSLVGVYGEVPKAFTYAAARAS